MNNLPKCPTCGKDLRKNSKDCIRVPTDLLLLRRSLYNRLAVFAAGVDVSSRGFPGWVADVVYEYVFEEGNLIYWPNGTPFLIGPNDMEDAFIDDIDRWIRAFRGHAKKPLKQRPQVKLARRLRFIWLAAEITKRRGQEVVRD